MTRTRRTLAALAAITAWCVLIDRAVRGLHGCDECETGR